MGFEIPLDIDYVDHPKALKMIALIGKNADIYPIRLWCWCAKFARRGVIDGGAGQIEEACRWTGKPGALHAALIAAKVLEKDGKTVHDWMDHAGSAIQKYDKKKKAQRKKYADHNSEVESDSLERTPFSGNSSGRMPEECRNSSDQNYDPGKNSATTKTLLENTIEENTKEHPDESVALAQKFAFLRGCGTSPNEVGRARVHLADMIAAGISVAAIDAELERKGRQRSEPPWDLQKRLMQAAGLLSGDKNERGTGRAVGQDHRISVGPEKVAAIEAKTIRLDATMPPAGGEENPNAGS